MTFPFFFWVRQPSHKSNASRRGLSLESLEDRVVPTTSILSVPPYSQTQSALVLPPYLQLDVTPQLGVAVSQPSLPGKGSLPSVPLPDPANLGGPTAPVPSVPLTDPADLGGPTAPVPPPESRPLADQVPSPRAASTNDAPVTVPPTVPATGMDSAAFQSRLASFASPPEPQTVARPLPLAESNLALVGTLLTARSAEPPAPALSPVNEEAALLEETALLLDQAAVSEVPSMPTVPPRLVLGAQEALDRHLVGGYASLPETPQRFFDGAALPPSPPVIHSRPVEQPAPAPTGPVPPPPAVQVVWTPEERRDQRRASAPAMQVVWTQEEGRDQPRAGATAFSDIFFDWSEVTDGATEAPSLGTSGDLPLANAPPPAEEESDLSLMRKLIHHAIFAAGFTLPWWVSGCSEVLRARRQRLGLRS